jgi:hypothetical protein
MTTTMLASRFATEDTDVRITTYNGAKITTYRNIKRAALDRGYEKGLPPGDDGVWYWHLCDNRDNGPFITEEGALKSARRAIDGLPDPND